MWTTVLILLALLAIAWTYFVLAGENLSTFDHAPNTPRNSSGPPSQQHDEVVRFLSTLSESSKGKDRNKFVQNLRAALDSMGDQADLSDIEIRPLDAHSSRLTGLEGEWVLAKKSDPQRRLLYIHGGAFIAGSPKSHRTITTKLARMLGVSVLAIDYRLMPEHKRLDCLTDCQRAYEWILKHGPDGDSAPIQLLVAGDSAGGNLALVVTAWARDNNLPAANAVIAIAPATDNTFGSPTLRANVSTDPMLGPALGKLVKIPRGLLLWFTWVGSRVKPADPRVSPAQGELSNLPPILIHASEAEMLLGDARRYANKATAAGSKVELATWHHMVHVWHVFEPTLPEAKHAFEHIEEFVNAHGNVT